LLKVLYKTITLIIITYTLIFKSSFVVHVMLFIYITISYNIRITKVIAILLAVENCKGLKLIIPIFFNIKYFVSLNMFCYIIIL